LCLPSDRGVGRPRFRALPIAGAPSRLLRFSAWRRPDPPARRSSLARCPMPYTADISRTNPTCFLFLLDQSSSMAKPFGGPAGKPKAEGLADAINRLIQNLALKCAKSEGIRDYFHVGVIGYGGAVSSALAGKLSKQFLVPISALADSPLR